MTTNATGRPGDSTIHLRDGRRLAILEVGKRDGSPIFHFPWLVRALFRLSMRLSGSDAASIEKKLLHAGARLGAADQKLHPKVVQEILGHSTITMTLDTYSHVLPSLQKEAMEKWDGLFSMGDERNQSVQ